MHKNVQADRRTHARTHARTNRQTDTRMQTVNAILLVMEKKTIVD